MTPVRKTILATVAACLVGSVACDTGVEPPRALTLSLEVDRTEATLGQEFEFTYSAEGQNLVGLVIDFGDGVRDSIPLFGAQTADGFRDHGYLSPGSFEVTAELTAPPQGSRTATVSVTVSESPDGGT